MSRAQLTSTVEQNTGGAVAPYVAGKNFVINGGFDIWQRGTSFSLAASTGVTFVADRFPTLTGANQAVTISRQSTNDTTNLPNIQYCLRYQRNSGQTGTGYLDLPQNIETVNSIPLAGKTVTFSFYARAGANFSGAGNGLLVRLYTGTGTDQNILVGVSGLSNPLSTSAILTTTWQRFSYSCVIPATATQVFPITTHVPTGTAGANDYYEITGVQLEIGSVATPFSRAGGTLQGELALCQRYFEVQDWSINNFHIAVGWTSGDRASNYWNFLVPKRTVPAITWTSNGSGRFLANGSNNTSQSIQTGSITTTGYVAQTVSTYGAYAGYLDSFGLCYINAEL